MITYAKKAMDLKDEWWEEGELLTSLGDCRHQPNDTHQGFESDLYFERELLQVLEQSIGTRAICY